MELRYGRGIGRRPAPGPSLLTSAVSLALTPVWPRPVRKLGLTPSTPSLALTGLRQDSLCPPHLGSGWTQAARTGSSTNRARPGSVPCFGKSPSAEGTGGYPLWQTHQGRQPPPLGPEGEDAHSLSRSVLESGWLGGSLLRGGTCPRVIPNWQGIIKVTQRPFKFRMDPHSK